MYLVVDNTTNLIKEVHDVASEVTGCTTVFVEDSTNVPSDLKQNPTFYKFLGGQILALPRLFLSYAGSTGNGTITVTCNDNTVTSCTVDVAGKPYTVTLTSGNGTLASKIHPSLEKEHVTITASANGVIGASTTLGDEQTILVDSFTSTSDNSVHVVPSGSGSKEFVADYWLKSVPSSLTMTDLITTVNMLMEVVYGKVLPALTANNTVTLTADEQNGVTDITNNVLPNIALKLAQVAPVTGTHDARYEQFKGHVSSMATALTNYESDLKNITLE